MYLSNSFPRPLGHIAFAHSRAYTSPHEVGHLPKNDDRKRKIVRAKGTVSEHCKALVAEGKFEEFDGKYTLAA